MKHKAVLALGVGAALVAGGTLLAQRGTVEPGDTASADDKTRASSAAAEAARRKITDDPVAPSLAPQGYDVTIVSFGDYQCPSCRKLHATLEQLAASDAKVRIVYRDWPIFGASSVEAAKAAIASQWQGKHAELNDALMEVQGRLDSAEIHAAVERAGVDRARLHDDLRTYKDEIEGLLHRTRRQAAMMGLQGTPVLLVGPYLVPGAIDYAALAKTVHLAREFERSKASPER